MPARTIARSVSSVAQAGPMVQTIFVRRMVLSFGGDCWVLENTIAADCGAIVPSLLVPHELSYLVNDRLQVEGGIHNQMGPPDLLEFGLHPNVYVPASLGPVHG